MPSTREEAVNCRSSTRLKRWQRKGRKIGSRYGFFMSGLLVSGVYLLKNHQRYLLPQAEKSNEVAHFDLSSASVFILALILLKPAMPSVCEGVGYLLARFSHCIYSEQEEPHNKILSI